MDNFTDFEMELHKQSLMDEPQVLVWLDAEACGGASLRFLCFTRLSW